MLTENIQGFIFIFIFLFFFLFLGYRLLSFYGFKKKYFAFCVLLTGYGHFISAIIYCFFTLSKGGDARGYFNGYWTVANSSSIEGSGLITKFVQLLRAYIFGSSYLGTFAFFALLGSLSAIFYLIIFTELLKKIQQYYDISFSLSKIKKYSYLLVLWPSSLFWGSSIGKDSLSYFLIALFFLCLLKVKNHIIYPILLVLSFGFFSLLRPYLFLIVLAAFLFWLLFSQNWQQKMGVKFAVLMIVVALFIGFSGMIAHYGGFSSYSIEDIANRGMQSQQNLSEGTYFSVAMHNPYLLLLLLPVAMLGNLLFPLFIYASNVFGILASFENLLLCIFVWSFIKSLAAWKKINNISFIFSYMFWFFIFGMVYLGIMNTNLGLAARQKLMFLPIFLIIIFVTLLSKKQLRRIQV